MLFDYKKGRMTDVLVDGFVPCHQKLWRHMEGKPLFARPGSALVVAQAPSRVVAGQDGYREEVSRFDFALRALRNKARTAEAVGDELVEKAVGLRNSLR